MGHLVHRVGPRDLVDGSGPLVNHGRQGGAQEEQEDKNYSLAILGGDRGIHTFYGEDGVFVEKSGEEGCEEV